MEEILHLQRYGWNPLNNGTNYRFQLVQDFAGPSITHLIIHLSPIYHPIKKLDDYLTTKWCPPSYTWVIIPLTIDISPINQSYWTYKPTLDYNQLYWVLLTSWSQAPCRSSKTDGFIDGFFDGFCLLEFGTTSSLTLPSGYDYHSHGKDGP